MGYLANWLRMKDVPRDLDDPATTDDFHRRIIREKRFLRAFYDEAYAHFQRHTLPTWMAQPLSWGAAAAT